MAAIVLEAAFAVAVAAPPRAGIGLPDRVRRVVLHVLGGPSYGRPERRWAFLAPAETQARWKPRFGAHWIVWTDGSLWPRHPVPGEPASVVPPVDRPADASWKAWIARHAAPVYGHVRDGNSRSVGIEVAHSGRSDAPFSEAQVRSLAWLLRSLLEMSEGRLVAASILGHKDLDARPAYVREACEKQGCPYFADAQGRPFRRRVDPPEALFAALATTGVEVPRTGRDGDAELLRAEDLGDQAPPRVRR